MWTYYITLVLIISVCFFFLRKYFPVPAALTISLASLLLAGLFPPMVVFLGSVKTILVYVIALPVLGLTIYFKQMQQVALPTMEGVMPVAEKSLDQQPDTASFEENGPDFKNQLSVLLTNEHGQEINQEEATVSEIIPEYQEQAAEEPEPEPIKLPELIIEEEVSSSSAEILLSEEPVVSDNDNVVEAEEQGDSEDMAPDMVPENNDITIESGASIEEKDEVQSVEEPKVLAPEELVAKGLTVFKQGEPTQAVRYLHQAIAARPTGDVLYLAVSELSTIYQKLGLYWMAAEVIRSFINQPEAERHPGVLLLKQSMLFCQVLSKRLAENSTPDLPYRDVPESIKKQVFKEVINQIS